MTAHILLIASPLMKSTPALHRAMALAQAMHTALHIVAFDDVHTLANVSFLSNEVREQIRIGYLDRHERWLSEEADQVRRSGVLVTTQVLWGPHSLEEILIQARELPAALIVKDLKYEPLIKRALFSTQDLHLLRDSPCPVHLVTHANHALPMRILATVDVCRLDTEAPDSNDMIISRACALAMSCDAEVHLLYVFDRYGLLASQWGYAGADVTCASSLLEELAEADAEAFQALAERHSIPRPQRHIGTGHPGSVICAFADAQDMDVVLLSRTHRRGIDKWLGGTAEQILYRVSESTLSL